MKTSTHQEEKAKRWRRNLTKPSDNVLYAGTWDLRAVCFYSQRIEFESPVKVSDDVIVIVFVPFVEPVNDEEKEGRTCRDVNCWLLAHNHY